MNRVLKIFALLVSLTGLSLWGGNAYAAACTSIAATAWNLQTTWGGAGVGCVGAPGGIPGAADNATIATNVTLDAARSVTNLTVNLGSTLTLNTFTLTVSGNIIVNGTVDDPVAGANGVLMSTGAAAVISGNGNFTGEARFEVTGNTAVISGNWNFSGTTRFYTNGTAPSITGALTFAGTSQLRAGRTNAGATVAGSVLTINGTLTSTIATAGNFLRLYANSTIIGTTGVINAAPSEITYQTAAANLINNGTVTILNVVGNNAANNWTNAAGSTLNVSGTLMATGSLTANAAVNTVNYNGAAQTVKLPSGAPATYNNLTFSGSNVKTMPATAMTITGNFTMSGTATTTAAQALTVGGDFTIGATNTFAAGAFTHSVGGNWIKDGTFTANTSTVTFNGTAAQTIGGAATTTFNNLTVANTGAGNTTLLINTSVIANLSVNSGTLDLGTFTANRTAAGGTITVANGATLKIGGTNPFPTNYAIRTIGATSTVEYSGSNQTVLNLAAPGYGNLTLSGSGTKTVAGSFITRGDLTISGVTFASVATVQTVNGNISNTGTHTVTTGNITLSGGAAVHTLSGSGIYANLILNDALGATLTGSPTVSGVLTLTSGILTTGANILEVTSNCTTGISGGGAATYVQGNLTLHYPTNAGTTSCTFMIGSAAAYSPATVAMLNVTSSLANSSLTARTDTPDHADTTANISGVDAGKSVNRYWTLTAGGSMAFATYNTTFTFVAGDIDGGAITANFIIARKSSGAWNYPTMGAKNPTNTTATGMTQAGGFGEFVIGERKFPSLTILKSVAVISDPVNGATNPKFIPGAVAEYTIIVSNSGGPVDNNTTVITDPIPANTKLYVNDIGGGGSGPVLFTQGGTSSTLTYTFTALNDAGDDLSFSNDGGTFYTATPSFDASGCDNTGTAITNIRINPKGVFVGSTGPNPSFQLKFRICVK